MSGKRQHTLPTAVGYARTGTYHRTGREHLGVAGNHPVGNVAVLTIAKRSELTAVTLPKGIESIGSFAFDCYKLKDIYYAGSQADWAEVNKDYNWIYGTSAYTIHCSDGDLVKE